MQLFLTSSPSDSEGGICRANGLADMLRASLPAQCCGLFITSFPDDRAFTEHFASDMRLRLRSSGISCRRFRILDGRNPEEAAELVHGADLVILAGGHVPTQNRFFHSMGLREIMKDFHGSVLSISAGSMNAADTVYAQPELDGESLDPNYGRFLQGLGLTRRMLLPHYQETKDFILDGRRLFEDITYPDSMGREFIAIPDGAWLYSDGMTEEVRGEAWLIADGAVSSLCSDGGVYRLF